MSLVVLTTMGVGLVLRWALAGGPVPLGGFTRWRHVHSHLGYYAVLFPLVWAVWRRAGARAPERGVVAVYAAAVGLAVFGFLRVGGYGPEAMAGSTVVLLVWLRDAWRNRGRAGAGRDWLGAVPLTLPFAALCIPAVAVLQAHDPAGSRAMLNCFLALLLLGSVIPSALCALGAPAPPVAVLVPVVLLAAAWLGPVPSWWTAAGVVSLGLVLAWSVAGMRVSVDRRAAWSCVAAGLLALGSGVVPNTQPVAIGAIHFLVLGPVLDALTLRAWSASRLQRWASLTAAAAMGATLIAQGMGAGAWTPRVAAITGGLAVAAWLWRLAAPVRSTRPSA